MSAAAKEFVLRKTFKNVSEMKDGINVYSEEEEYFGIPWKVYMRRIGQNFGVFLHCSIDKTEKWQIEVDRDLKLITVTGKVLSRNQTKPLGNSEESTIGGILYLSHMCDAELAIRKCEEFLMENSEKTLKEKLKLAYRYNFINLKNKCLSKITTAAEIRSVLSHDSSEMDPSLVGALLQKLLTLVP
ncbi:unnamed protein product [Caenorhabditis nigoni]